MVGPCRAELREVQKIFKKHPDILAISVDEKSSSYVLELQKMGINHSDRS